MIPFDTHLAICYFTDDWNRIEAFEIKHYSDRHNKKENTMKKNFRTMFLAGLAFVCLSQAYSQVTPEEAIQNRVKQYVAAYNAGDADAIASIYSVNGTHTYALGFTHRGRVEIAKGLKEQFAGPMKGTRISITPLHIRPISSSVAVEEASFSVSGLKEPGGKALAPVNGFCLGVYQKEGDQWFAVAVQCMVPPPPQKK
jgi:uncharacterized protein (TIGR02246 family)